MPSLILVLPMVLAGCSLIGGGGDSVTASNDTSGNAAVFRITELERQLASQAERAENAERMEQRTRAEVDWLVRAAQEEPVLRARIIELEQEVARLNADSRSAAVLEANIRDLEAENDRLSRALRGDWGDSPGETSSGPQPPRPVSESLADVADFGEGNYAVHLGSYRSKEGALDGWLQLRGLYPELLGGLNGHFAIFDIASLGGRFFRLKAGPFDGAGGAQRLCRSLTAAGQYCVVSVFDGELLSQ